MAPADQQRRNPLSPSQSPDERLGRLHPATMCAAGWTLLALHRTRRRLRSGLKAARAPVPPHLPAGAYRGVTGVARRLPFTCLERALVLQGWLHAHGHDHDVVIGVARDAHAFKAHAWLDFEFEVLDGVTYSELHRLPAP